MEIQVPVVIPDPKFPKGMMLATPHSHVLHVYDVISGLDRTAEVYAGRGNPGITACKHTYILVVQKSPSLRIGSVLITTEGPTSLLSQCRILRKHQGVIVEPDSLDNVLERTVRQ